MSRGMPRRLLELADALQGGGLRSTGELARRLGVSERTVRRDLDRLRDLDMQVESRSGRNGGVSLSGGALLPTLRFTDDELLALVVGLGSVARSGDEHLGRASESALRRLDGVLPAGTRERVRTLQEAASFEGAPGGTPAPSEHLFGLAEAARARRSVEVTYRGPSGASVRRVDPYGLARLGNWYLSGYCHLRQDLRTFRVDRIGSVRSTSFTFEVPPGFDTYREVARAVALAPGHGDILCRARLETDIETATSFVPARLVALEPLEDGVRLITRSTRQELTRIVWHLTRIPVPVTIEGPPELIEAAKLMQERVNFLRFSATAEPALGDRSAPEGV